MSESRIADEMIAVAKGMLARGDKNQDVAAFIVENQGRIGEIHHVMTRAPADDDVALTKRSREIAALPMRDLPRTPYPTPFHLFRAGTSLWAVRVAPEGAAGQIQKALNAVHNAEQRLK
jgi:hypothetical protein